MASSHEGLQKCLFQCHPRNPASTNNTKVNSQGGYAKVSFLKQLFLSESLEAGKGEVTNWKPSAYQAAHSGDLLWAPPSLTPAPH